MTASPPLSQRLVDQFLIGRPLADAAANNLHLLRFIAAFGVLFAHSWPIALGAAALDPATLALQAAFGPGVAVGSIAVHAFFVISGYLVTKSAATRGGIWDYAKARALRIYPALFINVILTACVLGAAVTTLSLGAYFSDPQFWKFTVNNVFSWNAIYGLPGVFQTNPLAAVNGSLWTLPLEIRCYVAIGLLLVCGVVQRGWLFTLVALALLLGDGLYRDLQILGTDAAANCIAMFLIGALFYVNRRFAPPSPLIGVALLAMAWVVPLDVAQRLLALTGLAMVVLWSGLSAPRIAWPERAIGDPSYGVYIYAFPIQQLVVLLFGAGSAWMVVGVAGVVTVLIGIVSWKLIEAPALSLKTSSQPIVSSPTASGVAAAQT